MPSNNSKKNSNCSNVDLLLVLLFVVGVFVLYYLYNKYYNTVEQFETTTPVVTSTPVVISTPVVTSTPSNDSGNNNSCKPEFQKIQGYRSLESGATLKFEMVGNKENNEFYLHGPPYKIVSVDKGNNLTLKGKNQVDANTQKFKKETKTVNGSDCVVFTYGDNTPKLALQYEHEHLSLRPLRADSTPFMGQCFVIYDNADVKEIEANSLALGIGIPQLGNEQLSGSGHNNVVLTGSGFPNNNNQPTPTVVSETDNLGDLTQAQFQELMKLVLKDVKLYQETVNDSKPGNQNPFAFGEEGLNINVNLGSGETDGDTFTDLKGDNASTSVRDLLNNYTKSKKGTSFLQQVEEGGNMKSVSDVLRNRFKGCPGFDRSKYLTERQIAQCSGCSPDDFLRGKL